MERVVVLASLFAVLDRGELARDQIEVEGHEGCDNEGQHARQDVRSHHEVGNLVVEAVRVAQSAGDYRVAGKNDDHAGGRAVEKHVHEEFVVVESNAVGHPRAVVIHLHDTLIASAAMVSSRWLQLIANVAVFKLVEFFSRTLVRN